MLAEIAICLLLSGAIIVGCAVIYRHAAERYGRHGQYHH